MAASPAQVIWACGRPLTESDLNCIRDLITTRPELSRTALSREVCDALGWLTPNGQRKDMSCRVALRRLEQMGLLTLPPSTRCNENRQWQPRFTPASAPGRLMTEPAHALEPITLAAVTSRSLAQLWNELIARYHYLGYRVLPGAQIRYLIYGRQHLLGALSFSAAAWKIAPRDRWIGWSDEQRRQHLHLIVGNSRFLILPWVKSKNLASKILSLAARQLPTDWQQRQGFAPVLLETFVETPRFHGTCYQAANWIHLGQTQGRGRMDRWSQNFLPIKAIYVYPLRHDFRRMLQGSMSQEATR